MIEQLESRFLFSGRWAYTGIGGIAGPVGTTQEIGYSIRLDGSDGSTFIADAVRDFGAANWLSYVKQGVHSWSAISGAQLTYEANDDGISGNHENGEVGVRGDIRIGSRAIDGPGGAVAEGYPPSVGEIYFDIADMVPGRFCSTPSGFISVMVHEVGHALGLDHSTNQLDVMYPISHSYQSPQAGDIVIAQQKYGIARLPGDANLDGKVNVDDYVRIDSGIGIQAKGWGNGDFNGDGVINVDDYAIIDSHVGWTL